MPIACIQENIYDIQENETTLLEGIEHLSYIHLMKAKISQRHPEKILDD